MLIGLTGYKGVGKDTAAGFLDGYTKLAFADKLKEAVANLFRLTVAEVDLLKSDFCWVEVRHPLSSEAITFSWREFLQRFGTEMGRDTFGKDFWTERWQQAFDQLYEEHPKKAANVVVTDVRFPNEAARIHFNGGVVIKIERPGFDSDGHASEIPLDSDLIDATVLNNGPIEDFGSKFLATVQGLKHGVTNGA